MRDRLQTPPTWVLSVALGTLFGGAMIGFGLLQRPGDIGAPIVGGVIAGALFGGVMGPWAARTSRQERQAAGSPSPAEWPQVKRVAFRGPVPTDPRLRQSALSLVRHRLDQLKQRHAAAVGFFALGTMAYVVVALAWTPWWLLAAAVFVAMLAYRLWLPSHLQRRIGLLEKGPSHSTGAS